MLYIIIGENKNTNLSTPKLNLILFYLHELYLIVLYSKDLIYMENKISLNNY